MISSYITGGLGNQLFMISTGLSLARDTNQKYALCSNLLSLWKCGTGEHPTKNLRTLYKKIDVVETCKLQVLKQQCPAHVYKKLPHKKNVFLKGWFQSEKYFKHNKQLLLDTYDFSHVKPLDLDLENFCSIHVRRGDFKLYDQFYYLPEVYYENAIKKTNQSKFLVFSNDISWCKTFFGSSDQFVYMDTDPVSSIHYMSQCGSNIIANSTFSWWGAWLNKSSDNQVVCPRVWFNPNHPSSKARHDLYSNTWLRV